MWYRKYGCGRLCAACEELDLKKPMICSWCENSKEKRYYSKTQQQKVCVGDRVCNTCEKSKRMQREVLPCVGNCGQTKQRSEFSGKQLLKGDDRKCKECVEADVKNQECVLCGVAKPTGAFSLMPVEHERRVCNACKAQGELLPCAGECCQEKTRSEFSHTQLDQGDYRKCKGCVWKRGAMSVFNAEW